LYSFGEGGQQGIKQMKVRECYLQLKFRVQSNLRSLKTIRKPTAVSNIDGDHHPRSTTKLISTVPLIPNQEREGGAL